MKHILCLLPVCAPAENAVYNRTGNLMEEYVFPEGAPVLEIVFPRVYSSDCAILRFGEEVIMIDASTKSKTMRTRIRTAV